MKYKYHTVDVFTERRFGGNPLAVLPEAFGLSDGQMQSIAREFNYSETSFVLPPQSSENDAAVRIFTPEREIPFAGHPNIGTAYVLSSEQVNNANDNLDRVLRFEEPAGIVSVLVRSEAGIPVYCELTAPEELKLEPEIADAADLDDLARAVSLNSTDILTDSHFPRIASVGLPFLCVEVRDREALARSQLRADNWAAYRRRAGCDAIHLYTLDTGSPATDVRCRMYVSLFGVREDPATGSANCALAGLLASLASPSNKTLTFRIAQGIEMGRPSTLLASVEKRGDGVAQVRIGGPSVSVTQGLIEVD